MVWNFAKKGGFSDSCLDNPRPIITWDDHSPCHAVTAATVTTVGHAAGVGVGGGLERERERSKRGHRTSSSVSMTRSLGAPGPGRTVGGQ